MILRLLLAGCAATLVTACAAPATSASTEVYDPPYTPTGSNVIRRERTADKSEVKTGNRDAAQGILTTPQGTPMPSGGAR